jgi:hypothetical protein
MTFEFQAIYRLRAGAASAVAESVQWPAPPKCGELHVLKFEVNDPLTTVEKRAREMLGPDVEIVSLTRLRVALQPNQRLFNRDEAGEYLRHAPNKIDELMAQGALPKARDGRPLFTREMLEDVVCKRMNGGDQ